MPDDVRSEGDPEADVGVGLRRVREALATIDARPTAVLARAATGREGFIIREWGFITPGGLGVPLGGKFAPLEKRLAGVAAFFPEPAACAPCTHDRIRILSLRFHRSHRRTA